MWGHEREPAAISASVSRAKARAAKSCAGQSMRRELRGQVRPGPRVSSSTTSPRGTFTKKIDRHPAASTRAPPTIGPAATAAPLIAAQAEMARARGAGSG